MGTSLYQSAANQSFVLRDEGGTYGVRAPNDAQAVGFRQTGGSALTLSKGTVKDREIRRDLQQTRDRHGARSVAGRLESELSIGTHNYLIASALRGTWAPVTGAGLRLDMPSAPNQIVRRSFTGEEQLWDIGASKLSTGCRVTGMTLGVTPAATVSVGFEVLGQDQDALDGTTTPAAMYFTQPTISTGAPLAATDLVLTENGAAVADLTAFSFTLTLNAQAEQVVASLIAPDVVTGQAGLTASLSFLRRSLARYKRFRAEQVFGVSGLFTDPAGNTFGVLIPNCTLGAISETAAAQNGSVIESCPLLIGAPPGGSMLSFTSSV